MGINYREHIIRKFKEYTKGARGQGLMRQVVFTELENRRDYSAIKAQEVLQSLIEDGILEDRSGRLWLLKEL